MFGRRERLLLGVSGPLPCHPVLFWGCGLSLWGCPTKALGQEQPQLSPGTLPSSRGPGGSLFPKRMGAENPPQLRILRKCGGAQPSGVQLPPLGAQVGHAPCSGATQVPFLERSPPQSRAQ